MQLCLLIISASTVAAYTSSYMDNKIRQLSIISISMMAELLHERCNGLDLGLGETGRLAKLKETGVNKKQAMISTLTRAGELE